MMKRVLTPIIDLCIKPYHALESMRQWAPVKTYFDVSLGPNDMKSTGVTPLEKTIEKLILDRIDSPGWVTTRGILLDPEGKSSAEEHRLVEQVMISLAERGQVTLWRLILQDGGENLLAAARPGLELDKDLEKRGAWARAEPHHPQA